MVHTTHSNSIPIDSDLVLCGMVQVLERDHKLGELDRRAENLQEGANQFEKSAVRLRKKHWWQNMKLKLGIGAGVTVLVLIIVIYLAARFA